MNTGITLDEMLTEFRRHSLTDLYITGFIDSGNGPTKKFLRDNSLQFNPLSHDVYILLENRLLKCRSIDQYSKLRVESAERFECSFDIDPDDTFGVMSVMRIALGTRRESAQIDRVDLYLDDSCDPENCVFAALGIALDQGDYIFFDPLDFDGMGIGGERTRHLWSQYWGERYSLRSYSIQR